jgi:uncharacterized protein (DUF2164 family)
MPLELSKENAAEAVASLKEYSREHMDEPLGDLAAGLLLEFFLAEIAPCAYNQAVSDVQKSLHARIMDLDMEVHADEFAYWASRGKGARK